MITAKKADEIFNGLFSFFFYKVILNVITITQMCECCNFFK